ncbi:lysozyme [Rhizobium hidalgonense]|uniref:Lysozyme n=1 Tax=Rhizobium hidalgonense TaxID=1538159 RepID=A0AAJ2H0B4_9HYPH|nr:lysozyme [Rhizobium hidalgonense]MDR9777190.1 lysozyme [Rhizobium hidalgonense]
MRKISAYGISKLKQWEGEILFAYDDFDPPSNRRRIKAGDKIKGTLTIGTGHTGPDVRPGMTITSEQSTALLYQDLASFEAAVESAVKVPLTDNQFAALVSFAFNVGAANFRSSTLLKKLNAGNYAAVPAELAKWTKSKGKTMPGLVNRRAAEAGLWAEGAFVQSSGTVADKQRAPLITGKVASTATALISGGGLQMVPHDGPIAYALAAVLVIACLVGGGLYVWDRVKN